MGMSVVVLMFLNEPSPDRFVLTMGFDDAPHLSDESKAKLLAAFPPHERDARSKGIPRLGSGAIYPVPETEYLIDDFELPKHWPKGYALDVGWNRTAALWGAWNREADIVYLYSEHYQGQAEPSIHADAIKARGNWIPGVIDPAARGRSQHDGSQLITKYNDLGLLLEFAQNGVESGIYEVWQRLSTGRIKMFKSLGNLRKEMSLYRRDEKGRIVKENDHLCDDLRYLVHPDSLNRFKVKPSVAAQEPRRYDHATSGTGWMG